MATQNQKLGRGKLIAHEAAHMWFGDLVTMKWFDDVWLKEVFANFFADKIAKPAFPDINHDLKFLTDHYSSAYSEDRTQGATPIKQPLNNLKNAGTLYGRIIYNKSPIMMRQLEAIVGKDKFREGMRKYIKKFANSNADWSDLIKILDQKTTDDLKQWSNVWVYESGRPIISSNITYKDDVIETFELSQKAEDGSDKIWQQTFKIGLIYKDSVKVVPIKLKYKKQSEKALTGLPKPENIVYNYDAFGYGIFPLNTLKANTIPTIKNDLARAYSYINLYENMLAGNIAFQDVFNILLKGIAIEKEELILNIITSKVSSVFWKFIPENERISVLKPLENTLKERLLKSNQPPSIIKTIYNTFKNIAYSETGKDFLYNIWSKSEQVPNLYLNENDYTDLASTLVLFNHSKTNAILETATQRL